MWRLCATQLITSHGTIAGLIHAHSKNPESPGERAHYAKYQFTFTSVICGHFSVPPWIMTRESLIIICSSCLSKQHWCDTEVAHGDTSKKMLIIEVFPFLLTRFWLPSDNIVDYLPTLAPFLLHNWPFTWFWLPHCYTTLFTREAPAGYLLSSITFP